MQEHTGVLFGMQQDNNPHVQREAIVCDDYKAGHSTLIPFAGLSAGHSVPFISVIQENKMD